MSLINDALKQARKGPPENTPGPLQPLQQLQPAASEPNGLPAWLLPTVVILLVVAAIFFIGWAVIHHDGQPAMVTAPAPAAMAPAPAAPAPLPATPTPVVQMPAAAPPQAAQPAANPAPTAPPLVLKLQGIDYLQTVPSAILNGKTVHPGDAFHQYRVKMISNNSVTLVGPDNKDTVVEMGN